MRNPLSLSEWLWIVIAPSLLGVYAAQHYFGGTYANIDGIGGLAILPWTILALYALPAAWVGDALFHRTAELIGAPTPLKFIPLLIAFVCAFVLCFGLRLFFTRKSESKDAGTLAGKYLAVLIVSFLLYAAFIYMTTPTLPFVSEDQKVEYCGRRDACIRQYLHSVVPNCRGETSSFQYPFKTDLPTQDTCFFENFIRMRPFTDINVGFDLHQYIGLYEPYDWQMGVITSKIFYDELYYADVSERILFCNAFSHTRHPTPYTKADSFERANVNLSAREYCQIRLQAFSLSLPPTDGQCEIIRMYVRPEDRLQRMCPATSGPA